MLNLSDDKLRKIMGYIVNQIPSKEKFQELEPEIYSKIDGVNKESGIELKNHIADKLKDIKWNTGLSEEELIELAKRLNYGPLMYAVAKKISPAKRKEAFPEIAGKFESVSEDSMSRLNPNLVDEVGRIFVVTVPTPMSTLVDILFETTVPSIGLQFLGGLRADDILGVFKNPKKATAFAKKLLPVTEAGGMGAAPGMGTTTANTAPFAIPLGSVSPAAYQKKKKKKRKSK